MRPVFVVIGILWFLAFGFAGVVSLITGHSVPLFDGPPIVHGRAAHLMGTAWLGAACLSLAYLVLARDFKVRGPSAHLAFLGYWLLGLGIAGSAALEVGRVYFNLAP